MKEDKAKQIFFKQLKESVDLKSNYSESGEQGLSGWGFSCGGIVPPNAIRAYIQKYVKKNEEQ